MLNKKILEMKENCEFNNVDINGLKMPEYKFYEITFDDEWGMCIKATSEPTGEQFLNFISEKERGNYTVDNIVGINEISKDLVPCFYDISNIDNWKVLNVN